MRLAGACERKGVEVPRVAALVVGLRAGREAEMEFAFLKVRRGLNNSGGHYSKSHGPQRHMS